MRRGHPPGVNAWLAGLTRPLVGWIAIYLVCSIGWHALTAAIALTTGSAVDSVTTDPVQMGQFQTYVLVLLAVVVVRGLCGLGSTISLESVANGLARDVRSTLFKSLLRKNQTFFNRRSTGDLTARATGDAERVNLMVSPGLDMAVDVILSLIVPLAAIALIDWRLMLWPGLFLVLFVLAVIEHNHRLSPVSAQVRHAAGQLAATATEAVEGMEFLEASGGGVSIRRRFADRVRSYRDLAVRQVRRNAAYFPPLALIVAMTGAVLQSLSLARAGQLSVGEVVAYLGLISTLRGPINIGGTSLGLIVLGQSSAKRIYEVVADPTGDDEHGGGFTGTVCGGVEFEAVTFAHGDRPVLSDVSFKVEPGELIAIVGSTGSGKTTLLQLLNGTYLPDQGQVRVDGRPVCDWDLTSLRAQIAVVEQDVMLFSRSVRDNLTFGLVERVDEASLADACEKAQVSEFVATMPDGLETLVGERGVTLSGGQRQRVGIARALLVRPSILVMDDSTSALDSTTERRMREAIFGAARGRTTLLITNRLSWIGAADRILILDHGRVVGYGTHRELLASNETYVQMHEPYRLGVATAETAPQSGGH